MEIFTNLGIDWKLLVAQIINFGILFFALYKLLYKPLLSVLDKRTKTIEKSLKDAKEIEKKLADAQLEQQEIITKAKKEAAVIIEQANKMAEQNRLQTIAKGKQEINQLVSQARTKFAEEKNQLLLEAKNSVASLVLQSVKSILKDLGDKEIDRELINKTIEKIK